MTGGAHDGTAVRTAAVASPSADATRTCDGIICFGGEDWWYHNRGHYDMQMMRELSRGVPVLYVNSIGMRVPRVGEGKMFVRRVARKLRSLSRGVVRVRERFSVFSPVTPPAGMGASTAERALAWQVRRAARSVGIRSPLVWVACPPAATVLDRLGAAGLVYQRTDRFEEFTGVDPERIGGFDRVLKERADVTLFCSSWLHGQERDGCRNSVFVDHGVDYASFVAAGRGEGAVPEDMGVLPRPLVGFVGGIDAHTFDAGLFLAVARSLRAEAHFALVGGCSLPPDWCREPNVSLLGRKGYEQVPGYMAASDVLIMPWNQNEWIRACNPVKLKEYLAVGRPIVSTPFPELDRYQGLVRVGADAGAFSDQIRGCLSGPGHDAEPGRRLVEPQTWGHKSTEVTGALARAGVKLIHRDSLL